MPRDLERSNNAIFVLVRGLAGLVPQVLSAVQAIIHREIGEIPVPSRD